MGEAKRRKMHAGQTLADDTSATAPGWQTVRTDGALMDRSTEGIAGRQLHWRPIATAPRDGPMIFVAWESKPTSAVGTVSWSDKADRPFPFRPTHWMPVP